MLADLMMGGARRTKRLWSDEEKRSICFHTAAPGVSVAQVAQRYAVNASLIFKWLRDPRFAPDPALVPAPSEEARFLPMEIVAKEQTPAAGLSPRAASRSNWQAVTRCGSAAAMMLKPWRG